MIIFITVCIFILALVLTIPIEELMPRKYLHHMLNIILSNRSGRSSSSSTLINRINPLISLMITVFRIDGFSPRWHSYRNNLRVSNLEEVFTIEQFVGFKSLISVMVCCYCILLSLFSHSLGILFLGLAMTLLCFYLPDQWLKMRIKRNRWQIQKEIPSVLISLAVTTDAGMSFLQALEEICSRKEGMLVTEIQKTLQEIALGIPQKEAFEKMADRVLVEELTLFISVLIQTLEKGSSGLTQMLRHQANQAWIKRKSKAKELGEKASIKLFFPLIFLILPALMIFLITPAIFSILKFFIY